MRDEKWCWSFVVAAVCAAVLAGFLPRCFSYEIPRDDTRAEYLYVFGPQGNPFLGADDVDHEQTVFVDVPATATSEVFFEVYDPDTGGFRDLKPSPKSPWDTVVEFSVYGNGAAALASKSFGESPEYDRKYYLFGPFKKEEGKKINDVYRFVFVAKAIKGQDQNLFKLRISPQSARAYSDKISFRLLPNENDEMYFYARLPAGVSRIVAENYDLDPDGGSASLVDRSTGRIYAVVESQSGKWASTPIDLGAAHAEREVVYTITKKTQHYANAAVRLKDQNGTIIPLYYSLGKKEARVRPRVSAPPIAAAAESKCNTFTFDATGSYDLNKEAISYLWDFGDGATSNEPVVTHVYEKGGEYTVTLTVKDTSGLECDTATSTQKVKVNTPPQPVIAGPDSACTGHIVLLDASRTSDNTPQTLTYSWDLGDGTKAEGKSVSKVYQKGGTYKIALQVNDNAGTSCSTGTAGQVITVNAPPVANAGEDIDLCFAADQPLRVTLDGGRSQDADGDALTYDWNFGDGETATGRSVTHVYSHPGDYPVGLTVNDGRGAACSTGSDTAAVRVNRKPIANAGKDGGACAGTKVTFDGSLSQGENLSYSWDFGDGQTDKGARVGHIYEKGGTYKAVLTVDDGKGTRCSQSAAVVHMSINESPTVSLRNEPAACQGDAVKFSAQAQDPESDPLLYTWDFGDGTVVTGGAGQSHEYSKGGVYTVTVTVDDKRQTPCSVASAVSRVRINSRPNADAGPNLVCCIGKESLFDASASSDPDGDALSYRWNFGDGATAEGAKVSHAYAKSGTYTVTLVVDDGSGTACSRASASFEAKVNERPVSVIKVK